jgi:hypothetical protein
VIGDTNDILGRVKRLIPNRWFLYIAPYRDAVLGGLSDLSAWCYNWIVFAKAQSRLATAFGIYLDVWCYDFLGRNILRNGATDAVFQAQIQATILKERVTRLGMNNAITTLTGTPPVIFEPWNTGDAGAWDVPQATAWDTAGGWGEMNLQGQVFLKVTRGAGSGIPGVNGWDGYLGGWDQGAMEFVSDSGGVGTIGITNGIIYSTIIYTKPTGVTCWTQIQ